MTRNIRPMPVRRPRAWRRPPRWRARIARAITVWLTTSPRTHHQTWRY
jgi:hypothetical protein